MSRKAALMAGGRRRWRGRSAKGSQRIFALPVAAPAPAASAAATDGDPSVASPTASMRTVGVDLSATKQRTAIAAIEWGRERATVAEPAHDLSDDDLVRHLAEADWVGIDAPFGWPEAMVEALHVYADSGCWPTMEREAFRYRRTDRFVHDAVLEQAGRKLWPLSVSSDRIALTARRAAQLRERAFQSSGVRFDRIGADRVVEVYPAAALLLWGLQRSGYKTSRQPERRAAEAEARTELLTSIEAQAP